MWFTLAVMAISVVFLWREARAVRRGVRSRRQFVLRAIGCALLVALAMLLQFREALLPLPSEAGSEVRLLRLLQFLVGVFVLVTALVLVALLDMRESLQRYLRERKQMADNLLRTPPTSCAPSSDGEDHENSH